MRKHKQNIIILLLISSLMCGCAAGIRTAEKLSPLPASPHVTKFLPEPTPKPLIPLELVNYNLDETVFDDCAEAGIVMYQDYETYDYVKGGTEPITKQLSVYLPYGYNAKKQYDVLVLMHVSGTDENFWLNHTMSYASHDHGYITVKVKNMLDNMIQRGNCPPCIVVSADGFLYDEQRAWHDTSTSYSQFAREFGADILPCIVENYSTYAAGSSREELAAAREHFGFMGASYGAYMCYLSVLPDNLDVVSNFGLSGGGAMDYGILQQSWASHGTEAYPINCLYIGTGEYDNRAGPEGAYLSFMQHNEKFSQENLYFSLYSHTGHEAREWINSLYNCLQLFYR